LKGFADGCDGGTGNVQAVEYRAHLGEIDEEGGEPGRWGAPFFVRQQDSVFVFRDHLAILSQMQQQSCFGPVSRKSGWYPDPGCESIAGRNRELAGYGDLAFIQLESVLVDELPVQGGRGQGHTIRGIVDDADPCRQLASGVEVAAPEFCADQDGLERSFHSGINRVGFDPLAVVDISEPGDERKVKDARSLWVGAAEMPQPAHR